MYSWLPHTEKYIFVTCLGLASVFVTIAWNGEVDIDRGSGWNEGFIQEWNDLRVADIYPWCLNGDQCYCHNPLHPERGIYSDWVFAHEMNAEKATFAPTDVDVVFYGDSIIEGWRGTSKGEKKHYSPKGDVAFQSLFQKKNGGAYDGIPLGIAGDRSPNLLWRILNGELPSNLQPKVIWILIGSNDFVGGYEKELLYCSPESVLMGIKRVIEEIVQLRPRVKIVLNGLLPRKEIDSDQYGPLMEGIQSLNDLLQKYCDERSIHYYDANKIFLTGKWEDLFQDVAHPSELGYQIWGESIAKELKEMIK